MGKNTVCVVCGSSKKENKKLTFHPPSSHEPTRKKWTDILRHLGRITDQTLVCSKHFKDTDFVVKKNLPNASAGANNTGSHKVLKRFAVPTQNLRPQSQRKLAKVDKQSDKNEQKKGVEEKLPIKITIKKEKDSPKVTINAEKPEKERFVPKIKIKKEKEDKGNTTPKSDKKIEDAQKILRNTPKSDKKIEDAQKMPRKEKKEVKMPKRYHHEAVVQPRTGSRRAASKEALKQMQILLDDEADDDIPVEIPDDDDDVVPIPVVVSPPKKKYKLSHRKSTDHDREVLVLKSITPSITNHYIENNLELECWVEELEPCQKERNKKLNDEEHEIQMTLEQLIKACSGEVVHKSDLTSVIEIKEHVANTIKTVQSQPPTSNVLVNNNQSYQLVMDPRLGIIVGAVPTGTAQQMQMSQNHSPQVTVTPTTAPVPATPTNSRPVRGRRPKNPQVAAVVSPQATPQPRMPTRGPVAHQVKRSNPVVAAPSAAPPVQPPSTRGRSANQSPPSNFTNVRPTESSVEGGIAAGSSVKSKAIVDLTSDDGRPLPDSREISFNKLQGKTFPSLVVVARPHLRVTDINGDRGKLDLKVKSVLMHPPSKFVEWLIQQGLVRSEQRCSVHNNTQLKLGMYSDVSKFPFSGGYVWISECCPQRFVSVFSGSLFEGSSHPPVFILKLLYHWACQTNIQNVTQWVKVDNLYVKGMFTWLRAVCTSAVQTHVRQLGGPHSRVEVGVISLGTTSQDGNSRQVKVEVLGVLEAGTRLIRLRAVEPLADNDRNYKKRFSKILEPLVNWVHPATTIVTDLTVDKATLHQMGFANVVQATSSDMPVSNRTVMEYLRRIVPRMFQNTLSLLSRQIIQQFLDELVWREWFGTTSLEAFDNLVTHLAEQTRHEGLCGSLINRLNKIALNPFKNWALNKTSTPTIIPVIPPPNNNASATSKKRKRRENEPPKQPPPAPSDSRPPKSTSPDVPEQMVPLENYYYGTIDLYPPKTNVALNMKCPFCKDTFTNNILLMNHLFQHAHNVSKDGQMCRYCLTSVPTANDLLKHIATSHPCETKFDNGFVCLICEMQYMNPFILGKHMSKEHSPSELPYQCGTCGYRCSNHKQAIDHFYKQHENGSTIQCPFCLKSTTVFSSSRNITQNMNYFIQHLQKHQRKQFARRCGKCNLWFVQKDILREHQSRMHGSQRGRPGLVPWTAPRNGVMVPKSRADIYPCDADGIDFAALRFNVPSHLRCRECDKNLDTLNHFPSFQSCQSPNCQYSTCCSNAMQEHQAKCSKTVKLTPAKEPLPYEMFCVCGYSSTDGNTLAKHLAICERKSAYPSKADALSASVTHSMLDVLGLVRKPEDTEKKASSGTKSDAIIVSDDPEVLHISEMVSKNNSMDNSGIQVDKVKNNLLERDSDSKKSKVNDKDEVCEESHENPKPFSTAEEHGEKDMVDSDDIKSEDIVENEITESESMILENPSETTDLGEENVSEHESATLHLENNQETSEENIHAAGKNELIESNGNEMSKQTSNSIEANNECEKLDSELISETSDNEKKFSNITDDVSPSPEPVTPVHEIETGQKVDSNSGKSSGAIREEVVNEPTNSKTSEDGSNLNMEKKSITNLSTEKSDVSLEQTKGSSDELVMSPNVSSSQEDFSKDSVGTVYETDLQEKEMPTLKADTVSLEAKSAVEQNQTSLDTEVIAEGHKKNEANELMAVESEIVNEPQIDLTQALNDDISELNSELVENKSVMEID